MEKKEFKTLEQIIQHVGGSMTLANLLGIEQINVLQWKHRGIPHKFWLPLVQKIGVSAEDLIKIDKKLRAQ